MTDEIFYCPVCGKKLESPYRLCPNCNSNLANDPDLTGKLDDNESIDKTLETINTLFENE